VPSRSREGRSHAGSSREGRARRGLSLPGWFAGISRFRQRVGQSVATQWQGASEQVAWLFFVLVWSLSLGVLLGGVPDSFSWKIALLFQPLALINSVRTMFQYRGELRFLREFRHLSQTLDDIRRLDGEKPFAHILEAVVRIVGFDRAVLLRPDPDGKAMRAIDSWNLPAEALTHLVIPRGATPSIAWRVMESGEPTIINDPMDHPEVNSRIFEVMQSQSLALTPISRGRLTLGLLVVDRQLSQTPITDDDLLELQVLADQIAVTLQNHALNEELARKAELLSRQHARFQQELTLAKLVQDGVLPRSTPDWPDLSAAAFMRSARFIGGDFYGFLDGCERASVPCRERRCRACPHHRRGIFLGDVAGKGIPAALVMAVVHCLFRARSAWSTDPAVVMAEVNEGLKFYLGAETRFFSSAFLGFHDPTTGRFQFANAGHDFPLFFRKRDGAIESLPSTGTLLGIFRESTFQTRDLELEPGDRLFFFTDGLVDFLERTTGAADGLEVLRQRLVDGSSQDPAVFIAEIRALVNDSGQEAEDDITALLVAAGERIRYTDHSPAAG